MDQFMERPGIAPAQGNGEGSRSASVETTAAVPRGLEDSPSGMELQQEDDDQELKEIRARLAQFEIGPVGGPGNPFGRYVARNRQIFLAAFSGKRLLTLIRKAEEMARGGNSGMMKLLMQYLVGTPVAAVNPDRVDHEEWELRREQPHAEEVAGHMESQLPHGVILETQRMVDVAKSQKCCNELTSGIAAQKAREAKEAARAERRARRAEERRRRREG